MMAMKYTRADQASSPFVDPRNTSSRNMRRNHQRQVLIFDLDDGNQSSVVGVVKASKVE